MSEHPIQLFIDFIQADQEIVKHEKQINALHKELESQEQQKKKLIEEAQTVKNNFMLIRKDADAYELEMKELDQKLAAKKEQLEHVSSNKEYQSLKAEIENFRKAQHALEEKIIKAWQEVESAKRDYETKKKASEELITTADTQTQEKKELINKLHQDIAQKKIDLQAYQQKVPEEWLEKYKLMRSRVTDPVVPVINNTCSACGYLVSDQDAINLRHRKLVQCKECFRLLYAILPQ